MCDVTGMETPMAKHIRAITIASSAPGSDKFGKWSLPAIDTYSLASHHIILAAFLSEGHLVCAILAVVADTYNIKVTGS